MTKEGRQKPKLARFGCIDFVFLLLYNRSFTDQRRNTADDQHVRVCGSFLQLTAGKGRDGLESFIILPIDARKEGNGNALSNLHKHDDLDKLCRAYCRREA